LSTEAKEPMKWIVLLFLLNAFAHGQNAFENPAESGNSFLSVCEYATTDSSPVSPLKIGICLGYVTGVSDGILLEGQSPRVPEYCLPKNVDNRQIFDTVVKFVKDHPAIRHLQTRELVARSLAESFPCKVAVGAE